MSNEEIIEGNKLIAEFMGGKLKYFNISNEPHYTNLSFGRTILFDDLRYNTSWDWLCPVIEKIGTIPDFKNNIDLSIDYFFEGDIHSVWLAAVEFIKWHNQTNQP